MLTPGTLQTAFKMYWDDMDRCRNAKAYWSLLHVTVCLPDICAALESSNGETDKSRYARWCNQYLPGPYLSGEERYGIRCKVLHQGRASTDKPGGRYVGFSFGQPSATGITDHMRVEGTTLNLDVGSLAQEVRFGVGLWIQHLEASLDGAEASNTEGNLQSLVQVRVLPIPVPVGSISGGSHSVTTSPFVLTQKSS